MWHLSVQLIYNISYLIEVLPSLSSLSWFWSMVWTWLKIFANFFISNSPAFLGSLAARAIFTSRVCFLTKYFMQIVGNWMSFCNDKFHFFTSDLEIVLVSEPLQCCLQLLKCNFVKFKSNKEILFSPIMMGWDELKAIWFNLPRLLEMTPCTQMGLYLSQVISYTWTFQMNNYRVSI